MSIDAVKLNLSQLIDGYVFRVPDFQREYVWGQEQVEDLVNDIISKDKGYFLGTLIAYGKNEITGDNKPMKIRDLTDGQQRITTIFIILSALKYIARDDKSLQEHVMDNIHIYEDYTKQKIAKDKLETKQKYLKTEILRNHEEHSVVKPENTADKNVKEAYDFCVKYLEEYFTDNSMQVSDGVNSVLNKLKASTFVYINLDTLEEAYEIFQTVNAKGVPLAVYDLVKSDVFSLVNSDNSKCVNTESYWKKIEDNCRSIGISSSDVLYHFWLAKNGYVNLKNLYSTYKSKSLNTSSNAEKFLKEFVDFSNAYVVMFMPSESEKYSRKGDYSPEIRNSLYTLVKVFKYTQVYPLIVSLIRANLNIKSYKIKDFAKDLKTLENYLFHAKISKDSRGWVRTDTFATSAKEVYSANNIKDLRSAVKKIIDKNKLKIIGYKKFEEDFKNVCYQKDKGNALISYILVNLHNNYYKGYLQGNWKSSLTVEHVIPFSHTGLDTYDVWVNSLVNLILIDDEINKKLKDKELFKKTIILKKYRYAIPDILKKYDDYLKKNYGEEYYKDKKIVEYSSLPKGETSNYIDIPDKESDVHHIDFNSCMDTLIKAAKKIWRE